MRLPIAILAAALGPSAAAQTFTNEEEVYFAKEAGRPAAPWFGIRLDGQAVVAIDRFGAPIPEAPRFKHSASGDGMTVTLEDGTRTTLRRARPATCWAATKRDRSKPDGSDDWAFRSRIALHDQGGRAHVGGDGAPAAVIRMRNVVWPNGANRPSLVLYIHTDDPDRAVAYAWADPGAARVGINLRWIQASCTIDGREPPASSGGGTP
jgi:hypothetical protein